MTFTRFTRPATAREQAADDAFADALDNGGDGSAAAALAGALRPVRPLNEQRRARMKDCMLAAFDAANVGDRVVAPLEAPEVATAEVLTEHGRVLMADVEAIGEQRAQAAAEAALRHVNTIKGEKHGLGTDWRL